ncbi:hypothetical protein A0H81_09046 [Grifola frondosa]|uniref:Uncharacterized protein n=1 Tax=Grifola frondosa TaxID=5627 RepID=A0A1C7M2P9_GRIFR|nr:hypothetical protein A0H81_09046 [Grifola frondosa]
MFKSRVLSTEMAFGVSCLASYRWPSNKSWCAGRSPKVARPELFVWSYRCQARLVLLYRSGWHAASPMLQPVLHWMLSTFSRNIFVANTAGSPLRRILHPLPIQPHGQQTSDHGDESPRVDGCTVYVRRHHALQYRSSRTGVFSECAMLLPTENTGTHRTRIMRSSRHLALLSFFDASIVRPTQAQQKSNVLQPFSVDMS